MAFFKKQEKNEKKEKDLQAEKNADKISLDDELLGSVAGGTFRPNGDGHQIVIPAVETDILKNFGINIP